MSALATGGFLADDRSRRAADAPPSSFPAPPLVRLDLLVVVAVLAWALGFSALRLLLSPVIGVDDAEMVLLGDGLHLAYHASRPPLHDWLYWLAHSLAGNSLATVVALKYLLLTGAALHSYCAARRLLRRPLAAAAALASLLYFYHLVYGLAVGYGNTASLLYVMAASLHLLVAMAGRPRTWQYLLLGLLGGLGLLAKQSYGLFLPALLLAALFTPAFRTVVRDRRLLLTALVAAAVVAPWALQVLQQRGSLMLEAGGRAGEGSLRAALLRRLEGLFTVGKAGLVFCFTFLVGAVPLLFWGLRTARLRAAFARPAVRLCALQILFGFGFLVLFVLATGSTWLKDRHLHAVVFFLPILVLAVAEAAGRPLAGRSWRARLLFGGAFAAVLAGAGGVVWLLATPPPDCGRCRYQKPLVALVERLETWGLVRGTLLSADEFAGAQAEAALPGLRVRSLAYGDFEPAIPAEAARRPRCLLLWPADLSESRRADYRAWVERVRGAALPPDLDAEPLYFASPANPEAIYGWELAVLPASGDCR